MSATCQRRCHCQSGNMPCGFCRAAFLGNDRRCAACRIRYHRVRQPAGYDAHCLIGLEPVAMDRSTHTTRLQSCGIVELIAEVGNDDLRASCTQCLSGRPNAIMMNDGRCAGEDSRVWRIIHDEAVAIAMRRSGLSGQQHRSSAEATAESSRLFIEPAGRSDRERSQGEDERRRTVIEKGSKFDGQFVIGATLAVEEGKEVGYAFPRRSPRQARRSNRRSRRHPPTVRPVLPCSIGEMG